MKISVVIPTYNRSKYLDITLKTCLTQVFENVEYLIQDDGSNDETKSISLKYCELDTRFKYFNKNENVGMRLNFEHSLNNATGEYIICLGGDDALMPNALENLVSLASKYPDKIITWPTAAYFYSEAREQNAQLIAPNIIFRKIIQKTIPSSRFFDKQVTNLFYVSDPEVPMLYVKSLVPRKLIDKVKENTNGNFFSSSTPDGFSAFALASFVESYIYINRPFTMHGVSPTSAGLNYVQGSNGENDLSQKFFIDSKKLKMSEEMGGIQYSPLITLMTTDFLYLSDKLFRHGHSKKIKINQVIRKSLLEVCDGLMNQNKVSREISLIESLSLHFGKVEYFKVQLNKMYRNKRETLVGDAISSRLLYIDAKRHRINDVYQATIYLQEYLNKKSIYLEFNWISGIINSLKYYIKGKLRHKKLRDYFEK